MIDKSITIRQATIEDAKAISDVVISSISSLCVADHNNSQDILVPWLSNKTPENFKKWMQGTPDGYFVAVQDKKVVGVGAMTSDGTITLNYIVPEVRFKGISKMLLKALEEKALSKDILHLSLTSTATAKSFYEAVGYELHGEPERSYGKKISYPMHKILKKINK